MEKRRVWVELNHLLNPVIVLSLKKLGLSHDPRKRCFCCVLQIVDKQHNTWFTVRHSSAVHIIGLGFEILIGDARAKTIPKHQQVEEIKVSGGCRTETGNRLEKTAHVVRV